MKKIIIFISCFLLMGCSIEKSSPTKVIENNYRHYQNLHSSVLKELDQIVEKEIYMDEEEKNHYKMLLKKQYQNLSFKIVNEEIIEDRAVVDTEIVVLDYASSILRSKRYYLENQEEFSKKIVDQDNLYLQKEFIDYMLEELERVNNKMKYGISFSLVLKKQGWEIEKINDLDIQKIQGLYY